jgi:hypothetical protein
LAGSSGSTRERLPRPARLKTAETVDSGIASVSAISAPVMRSLRKATTAPTRSGAVIRGIRVGRGERSRNPASPSARYRASHFAAVRSLTPAACAAAATRQPAVTRSQSKRRECGQVLALPCNFSWARLWSWGLRQPPASREARMNNLSRNYN